MKRNILMLFTGTMLLVFSDFRFIQKQKDTDSNRALVKRFHAIWSTGEVEALKQLIAPEFSCHFNAGADWQGIEGTAEKIIGLRKAFPDWNEEVVDIIAENDKVVTRYRCTATHQGRFYGIDATGIKVSLFETSIYRIANEKIVEQWCFADRLSLLQQLQPTVNLLQKLERKSNHR